MQEPSLARINRRDLNSRVVQDDKYPIAGGGNSNIYRGKFLSTDGRKTLVSLQHLSFSPKLDRF